MAVGVAMAGIDPVVLFWPGFSRLIAAGRPFSEPCPFF